MNSLKMNTENYLTLKLTSHCSASLRLYKSHKYDTFSYNLINIDGCIIYQSNFRSSKKQISKCIKCICICYCRHLQLLFLYKFKMDRLLQTDIYVFYCFLKAIFSPGVELN